MHVTKQNIEMWVCDKGTPTHFKVFDYRLALRSSIIHIGVKAHNPTLKNTHTVLYGPIHEPVTQF
ncbi:hypothetical protein KC19_9G126500 [Ceratodon purpureus]|uniref:Uncharacterized protein n=1 Tax=Ceratodon purpureus TaxID=3225 RepID=A0A8T0GWV2_CERPU|nr:hypothetical protein KC19_9G126500 [Ceratodon purpureus]